MKKIIIILAIGTFLMIGTAIQRANSYTLEKNPNQFWDQAGIHYFVKNLNNL